MLDPDFTNSSTLQFPGMFLRPGPIRVELLAHLIQAKEAAKQLVLWNI